MDSPSLSFLLTSLLLFTTFSLNPLSSFASQLTYTDHCASMVPNSTPNESKIKVFPYGPLQTVYYLGGDTIVGTGFLLNLNQKRISLRIRSVYETDVSGILNIGANLIIRGATSYYHVENSTHASRSVYRRGTTSIVFRLNGFWSESSGKLCMVGIGTGYNLQRLEAVLKLYNVANTSNSINTLVAGSLESLSSKHDVGYFEPISLFIFPRKDYEYTLDTTQAKNECSDEGDATPGLSINPVSFCSNLFPMINSIYGLQYSSDCNSAKNCNPLGGDAKQLPYIVSLKGMACSDVKDRVRVLIELGNRHDYRWSFNPDSTLVGEGWWDEKKNQLCMVACRFLGMAESVASVHVGDCSTRMCMKFPKIWSIKDASSIVGQIWSNKTVGDSDYFKRMILKSPQDHRIGLPGIEYEYSQLDTVRKLCPRQNPLKNKGIRYPDVFSSNMRFDMSVRNSNRRIAWGYSVPLIVSDQSHQWILDEYLFSNSSYTKPIITANSSNNGVFNISYKISINVLSNAKLGEGNSMLNTSTNVTETVRVSAEGIYDAEAGSLCLVGCRKLGSENQIPTTNSVDCETLVKFQFPPLNAKNNGGYIKGSIESTRKNSDPLYFKRLDLISAAFYTAEAQQMVRKIDMEVIMILVCTMLACVFLGLQLYHVTRNPDMLPLISLIMILILTLGNLIPLVLNFEALFAKNPEKKIRFLGNEWLEVNEIAVRLVVMVAFLLQLRLLQLIWSARKADGNKKGLWMAEKKVLYMIFPLYAAGFLIALLVNRMNNWHGGVVSSSGLSEYQPHSFWEDLKSYSGLVLDGFLLPQIMLNLFWNSKGNNALSYSFYFGTTLVRLLPHAYDLYEAHIYVDGSFLYEDEIADYYSTAWDIVIPLVALMLALIIYLQQRFGGHSILPWRIKGFKEYEMVPVVPVT